MSETTRITTIQITTINNKELEPLPKEKQREIADTIKILSGADDVLDWSEQKGEYMETSTMIRQLRRTAKKHENDKLHTFDTDISLMCTDVANRLEE